MIIGLIAGGGDLPLEVMEECERQSFSYCVVHFKNIPLYSSKPISKMFYSSLGDVGAILNFLNKNSVTHVIFAGHITRPNFTSLKLDSKGFQWLCKLGKKVWGGDDHLLTGIETLLNQEGFHVLSAAEFVKNTIEKPQNLTISKPSISAQNSIKIGINILDALSPFDVGQSIVMLNSQVIGIEAVEGTENLITRCGNIKTSNSSLVLVKFSKLKQSEKIDLPTIGPKTIKQLKEANFKGVAIEVGLTQIINKKEVIKLCNELNLFLIALERKSRFEDISS